MSWFDDLSTRAKQSLESVEKDIGSYLGSIKAEPTVKVGVPPSGNQTAAQIANGQYGGAAPVAAPAANAASIMNANPMAAMSQQLTAYLPLILGAAALMYFMKKS